MSVYLEWSSVHNEQKLGIEKFRESCPIEKCSKEGGQNIDTE